MSTKIIFSAFVLAGIGLVFCSTADARSRGRLFRNNRGSEGTYTAQASGERRLYSYEPDSGSYGSRGATSRSNVPLYLLPKSDPRKYDIR